MQRNLQVAASPAQMRPQASSHMKVFACCWSCHRACAGAFIAFIKLLQGLIQPTSTVPGPPTDIPALSAQEASVYVGSSPLALMRWKHPFFDDMEGRFPEIGNLLAGKYAWKVCRCFHQPQL